MSTSPQHAGRRRSIIVAAASVVLALVGALSLVIGIRAAAGPPQPPADAGASVPATGQAPTATAGGPAARRPPTPSPARTKAAQPAKPAQAADLGTVLSASPPVAIDIPSIAVRTSNLVDLGLAADGSLEAPTDFSSVGWYTRGPSPGQLGPAILNGHVDSHNGPAVFYRLGALKQGALINVARKDGSTARFTVDRIQRFPKNQFPTALVYGSTSRAELRLITCGGSFDNKTGHYVDNVVAFAHLAR